MTQSSNSRSNCDTTLKFLYSYGGKIVPRFTDGKLRYLGGFTRVLSVDRSITFSELMVKFGESCGSSMNLKCKLPSEDLDVLISVKSDEDLRNVIDEYIRVSPEAKIRAVLFPIDSGKKISPPLSPMSSFDFPSPPKYLRTKSKSSATAPCYYAAPLYTPSYRICSPAVGYPISAAAAAKYRYFEGRSPRHFCHVPLQNRSH